jgi:hypothetical protein
MARALRLTTLVVWLLVATPQSFSEENPSLQTYFKDYVGLSDNQIATIHDGQAFAKVLHSRGAEEIFVFGAVYIKASPESYLQFARDFNRMRSYPGYLAINEFSTPPQLSDLKGFTFDAEDIKDLQKCKPSSCEIQMPASAIEEAHSLVNWADPDAERQVDQLLQKKVIERTLAYQQGGNEALGVYNDKRNPTQVPEQFKYMLSFSKALPRYLPDFNNYLLSYPKGRPEGVEDSFYWAKVKFGLKPTLRVIHVVTMKGRNPGEPVYSIAEKQLYSSHYFQTALDLTFCVRDPTETNPAGFYLIKVMGSEQAGLTGFKGSIVRKVATDRSASSLQKSLAMIKQTLEAKP